MNCPRPPAGTSPPTSACVLLNPAAHAGLGKVLWRRVEPEVARFYQIRLVESDLQGAWRQRIDEALDDGIDQFIAAGGDGCVHVLLNALVNHVGESGIARLRLGAVGLGSSNDFHKPFGRKVCGVPVKVRPQAQAWRDICRARLRDPSGTASTRYFTISASIGVTAEANALFNRGDRALQLLKPRWTEGAIAYAATRSIARHCDVGATLTHDGTAQRTSVSNLSVLKTPHLSGVLRFDTPAASDDGLLSVNLCAGLGRLGLVRALADLARGRFLGPSGRLYWHVKQLQVELDTASALELDGELYFTRSVVFDVLPERVRECR